MASSDSKSGGPISNYNELNWENIPSDDSSDTMKETACGKSRQVLPKYMASKKTALGNRSGEMERSQYSDIQQPVIEKKHAFNPASLDGHNSRTDLRNKCDKKKNGNVRCELCGVDCTGQISYEVHLRGKKHKRKMRQARFQESYRSQDEEINGATDELNRLGLQTPLFNNLASASSVENYSVSPRTSSHARDFNPEPVVEPMSDNAQRARGAAKTDGKMDASSHLICAEGSQRGQFPHMSPHVPPYVRSQPLPNTSSGNMGKGVFSRQREEGNEGWSPGRPISEPRSGRIEDTRCKIERNVGVGGGGMKLAGARTTVMQGRLTPSMEPFIGKLPRRVDPAEGGRKNPFQSEVVLNTSEADFPEKFCQARPVAVPFVFGNQTGVYGQRDGQTRPYSLSSNVPAVPRPKLSSQPASSILPSPRPSVWNENSSVAGFPKKSVSQARPGAAPLAFGNQAGDYNQRNGQTRPSSLSSNVPAVPHSKLRSQVVPAILPSPRPFAVGKASHHQNSGGYRRDPSVSQPRGLDAVQGYPNLRNGNRYRERDMNRDNGGKSDSHFSAGDQYRNTDRARDGEHGRLRFRDRDLYWEPGRAREDQVRSSTERIGTRHAAGSSSHMDDGGGPSVPPPTRCEDDLKKFPTVSEAWADQPMSIAEWREFRHHVFNNGTDEERLAFKVIVDLLLSPSVGVDVSTLAPFSNAMKDSVKNMYYTPQGVVTRLSDYPDALRNGDPKYSSEDKDDVDWSRRQTPEHLALCNIHDNLEFMLNYEHVDPPPGKNGMGGFPPRGSYGVKGQRKVSGSMHDGERAPRYPSSVAEDPVFQNIMDHQRQNALQGGDDPHKRRVFGEK